MREIALDTETTGLDAEGGDRIVEIGAVELINHAPTGEQFHVYIDPGRAMSAEATDITGLSDAFLAGKPKFEEVAAGFLDFARGDKMVIHNAAFDRRFLNMELRRCGHDEIEKEQVVDTLEIARKRFPGAQVSLDALCRRFGVDNSAREKHGALLDAELLAIVYLELKGGRQPGLSLSLSADQATDAAGGLAKTVEFVRERRSRITPTERAAHDAFIDTLGEEALWRRIASRETDKTDA